MFSVPTLSIGDVGVVVRPLGGAQEMRSILAAIRSIKGVDRAIVDRVSDSAVHVLAHTDRPVALASEIRGVLRRRVASCTVEGGEIIVDLETELDPGYRTADGRRPQQERAVRDRTEPRPSAVVGSEGLDGLPVDPAAVEALDGLDDLSVFLFDREQRFTACAGGLHRRFGHEFASMQGRRAEDALSTSSWERLGAGYARALQGTSTSIDLQAPDGTVTESWFRPLRHGHDVVGGMVVTRDVTRQRQAQSALDEVSAVLRVTLDRAATPYALLAPNGRWVRVNAAMQTLLGVTESTLVREVAFERTHPDDRPRDRRLFDELAAGRIETYRLDKRIADDAGRWLPVRTEVTAIRVGGELRGAVATVADHPGAS